ncbi:hypothetical protein H8E77_33240 [bacterium]|nr:hypothetical protein [bacterium]
MIIKNDNQKGLSKIIGMVKKGGHPDDYSVNHDKYLADAYANESTENLREIPCGKFAVALPQVDNS